VAALWLIVALGAVGLDAALRSRARRLAAANLADETRARAAALAGTEYARSRLTAATLDRAEELRAEAMRRARTASARNRAGRQSVSSLFRQDPLQDPWRDPQDLVVPEMAFVDAAFTLRLRDTGAALNPNEADEQMLRQFFSQGLRLDFAAADRIAQAMLDWRDEDDLPRVNGGEREQYLDQQMPVLPPNRPFTRLAELRHILGMTPEIYEAARPFMTLIGSGRINVNSAPEPVLLALPGMTPGAATELLRLRESGILPRSDEELRAMLPGSLLARRYRDDDDDDDDDELERRVTFTTSEVEIASEGRVDGGPVRVRAYAVVTRANTGAVVVWRRIE
jgi:general secretion pathway protein K